MDGLVTRSLGGFYNVYCDGAVYDSKPRGLFRKEKTVITVGDRVEFSLQPDGSGTIEKLKERKNHFLRPPVSNLDRLFIVIAAAEPAPDTLFADKLTVIALHSGVTPVIVINKSDLADPSGLDSAYRAAGFETVVSNALTGEGGARILEIASDGISAFAGFSGAGKSSIITELMPGLDLETGTVSEKLGRGRHTTRHVELFRLPSGGFIADTPGFSSLELHEQTPLRADDLPALFPEFAPFLPDCRFTNCSHRTEKGCAVLAAVESGAIPASRHRSYKLLYDELKLIPDWK